MPEPGYIFIAAHTKGGSIRIEIEGPDNLDILHPVILTPCTIAAWSERAIQIQGSENIRIILGYERKNGGQIFITNVNSSCWIKTTPGGDIISGPPDRWIPQNVGKVSIATWVSLPLEMEASMVREDPYDLKSS